MSSGFFGTQPSHGTGLFGGSMQTMSQNRGLFGGQPYPSNQGVGFFDAPRQTFFNPSSSPAPSGNESPFSFGTPNPPRHGVITRPSVDGELTLQQLAEMDFDDLGNRLRMELKDGRNFTVTLKEGHITVINRGSLWFFGGCSDDGDQTIKVEPGSFIFHDFDPLGLGFKQIKVNSEGK